MNPLQSEMPAGTGKTIRLGRILALLTLTLIAATMVNVLFTFGQIAIGRGVKVYGVALNSPLGAAHMITRSSNQSVPILSGDTIEEVDGRPVRSAEEIVAALGHVAEQAIELAEKLNRHSARERTAAESCPVHSGLHPASDAVGREQRA